MTVITKDTLIGDVFKYKAGADEVIRSYFGDGCFTCPAVATEPLEMSVAMHGANLEKLLADLNALQDGVTEVTLGPEKSDKKPFFSRLFGK